MTSITSLADGISSDLVFRRVPYSRIRRGHRETAGRLHGRSETPETILFIIDDSFIIYLVRRITSSVIEISQQIIFAPQNYFRPIWPARIYVCGRSAHSPAGKKRLLAGQIVSLAGKK